MPRSLQIIEEARSSGRTYLLEPEAKTVCAEYGIPVPRFMEAHSREDAIRSAEKLGFPVVLKVVSPQVIHKSDAGGVAVGLKNSTELEGAYSRVLENVKKSSPKAKIVGVLVEEMAPPSIEIIVGAAKRPKFGPVIMLGLGGVFAEVLKDVSFRVAPIVRADALEMVTELKAYPLLKGYRNQPPGDIESLLEVLMKVSSLVVEHRDIEGIDLNPVLIYEKGVKAVDARIALEPPQPK